jgi:hypothetical protein
MLRKNKGKFHIFTFSVLTGSLSHGTKANIIIGPWDCRIIRPIFYILQYHEFYLSTLIKDHGIILLNHYFFRVFCKIKD